MKFDMHCHTKEGSLDGKAPIEEMIGILKERGFDGMLISDMIPTTVIGLGRRLMGSSRTKSFWCLRGWSMIPSTQGIFW